MLNNPLSLTDPTGYLSVGQIMRIAAAVLVTWATGGAAAALWTGGSVGGALTVAALGGAFATVLSTGSTKGAGQGAFSAMVLFGIGSYFESAKWAKSTKDATKLSGIGRTAKIVAHGVTGGVLSDVQGGKFAHGFFSAGFSEAAGPLTAGVKNDLARGVLHALVGGTASELSGGKFSNGAVTGAMGFAMGRALSRSPSVSGFRDNGSGAGGIDAPTDSLERDLLAVQAGSDESGPAAKRLISAAVDHFGIDLDPSAVTFDARYQGGAIAYSNGIVLIGPRMFETFGLLGSTLIHETVHLARYYPGGSLQNHIQEVQAYNMELSRSAETGVSPGSIVARRSGHLHQVRLMSPAAHQMVVAGRFDAAYSIADFERPLTR